MFLCLREREGIRVRRAFWGGGFCLSGAEGIFKGSTSKVKIGNLLTRAKAMRNIHATLWTMHWVCQKWKSNSIFCLSFVSFVCLFFFSLWTHKHCSSNGPIIEHKKGNPVCECARMCDRTLLKKDNKYVVSRKWPDMLTVDIHGGKPVEELP